MVEAAKILGGFEGLLEGRPGEPERAIEALQLALIDVFRSRYSR